MANEYEGGRQEGGAGDANAPFSMPGPEKSGQAPVPPASAAPHVQGQQPESTVYAVAPSNVKTMNKHVFVWVMCFLLGNLGVDRFVRGQIGLGVVKLLFGWATCGIWWLVDWVIAMVKAYGNAYSSQEDLVFLNGKYSR